jgi:hypothetical protein
MFFSVNAIFVSKVNIFILYWLYYVLPLMRLFWATLLPRTNPSGENLMEFLVSSNLNILNHGNEPTFVVCNRKEVIDLTLGTNKMVNLVSNWHVSDELSLSDHRYIHFQIGNITVSHATYRDPRRTNWESSTDNLNVNLETLSWRIRTIRDMDRSVDQLQPVPIVIIAQLRSLAHQGWHLRRIKNSVG